MLSTIDKANGHGVVNGKRKERGVWNIRNALILLCY